MNHTDILLQNEFKIDPSVLKLVQEAESEVQEQFRRLDEMQLKRYIQIYSIQTVLS